MSDPSKPVVSFSNIINDALDKQSDSLSPDVVQELQAARKLAVMEQERSQTAAQTATQTKTPKAGLGRLLAGLSLNNRSTYAFASFASIMFVAVLLLTVNSPGHIRSSSDLNSAAGTLAMLDEELSEDIEMLSDLEFAYWLAETSLEATDEGANSGDAS